MKDFKCLQKPKGWSLNLISRKVLRTGTWNYRNSPLSTSDMYIKHKTSLPGIRDSKCLGISKKIKEKVKEKGQNLDLVGGAETAQCVSVPSAVCPSATVSPKYNVQLHSRMEYTTFCLFRRDVIVDPEKYFEPRLLEIYIFFYYEMKKNRDAFL
jgi:hypothetical protein